MVTQYLELFLMFSWLLALLLGMQYCGAQHVGFGESALFTAWTAMAYWFLETRTRDEKMRKDYEEEKVAFKARQDRIYNENHKWSESSMPKFPDFVKWKTLQY